MLDSSSGIMIALIIPPSVKVEMRTPGMASVSVIHFSWSKMCHSMAKADSKMSGGKNMCSIRCGSMSPSIFKLASLTSSHSGIEVLVRLLHPYSSSSSMGTVLKNLNISPSTAPKISSSTV